MANKLLISAALLLSFSTLGVPNAHANPLCNFVYNISRFLIPKYDGDKMIAAAKSAQDEFLVDYAWGRELVLLSIDNNPSDAANLDRMIEDKITELENAIQNGGGLHFKDYLSEIEKLEGMRKDSPIPATLPVDSKFSAFSAEDFSKMELTPRAKVAAMITVVENAYGQTLTPPNTLQGYVNEVVEKAKVKDGVITSKEAGRILKLIVKRITPMELPTKQDGGLMTTNVKIRLERILTKSFKPAARRTIETTGLRDPFFRSYFDSIIGIDYRAPNNGVAKKTARNLFTISFATGIDIILAKMGMPPVALPGLALQSTVSGQVKNVMATKGLEEATQAMIGEFSFFRTPQILLRPVRAIRTRLLLVFALTYLGEHPQLITKPYDLFHVHQTTHSEAPTSTDVSDPTTTGVYDNSGATSNDYDAGLAIQNALDDFTSRTDIASDSEIVAMRVLYEKTESAARNGKSDSLTLLQASRLEIIKKYRLINWAISQKQLPETPTEAEQVALMNSSDKAISDKRAEINGKAAKGEYDDLYISADKLTGLYNGFASHYKK